MTPDLPHDEQHLARFLLEAGGDQVAASGRPAWALILPRPDGEFDIAVRNDDFDPVGWQAPPDCAALAVVATGRVDTLDPSVEPPAGLASGRAGGARMACVVSRRGRVGWHMVLPDGSGFDEAPEEGQMLDILRRCLGLATPPPPCPADVLVVSAWLGAVIDEGRHGQLLSWRQTLALHPAFEGGTAGLGPDEMVAVIQAFQISGSWERLRRAAAGRQLRDEWWPVPELAAWMDEGMFARWVLALFAGIEDLLARARPGLRPSAARRLAHLARSIGSHPPQLRSAG